MTVPYSEFRAAGGAIRKPGFYRKSGKRLLDLTFVLVMAPVVVPLLLVLIALVSISGGQPLYAQPRVGRRGRQFRCWKLRSMVPDADARLARMISADPRVADEWRRYQKLSNDPRITFVGRFLRKSSLDELPQLWNVLMGDMSLVGPRPFTPEQASLYMGGRRDVAYYALRPGITGVWQVGDRHSTGFGARAVMDRDYDMALGFGTDLAILARTVGVVLRGTGA